MQLDFFLKLQAASCKLQAEREIQVAAAAAPDNSKVISRPSWPLAVGGACSHYHYHYLDNRHYEPERRSAAGGSQLRAASSKTSANLASRPIILLLACCLDSLVACTRLLASHSERASIELRWSKREARKPPSARAKVNRLRQRHAIRATKTFARLVSSRCNATSSQCICIFAFAKV